MIQTKYIYNVNSMQQMRQKRDKENTEYQH